MNCLSQNRQKVFEVSAFLIVTKYVLLTELGGSDYDDGNDDDVR